MATVLITGTNRGIGLEFVKQYAEDGWRVIACCRKPEQANDLKALVDQFDQIEVRALDVSSQDQIKALAKELSDIAIDLLINNAGYYGSKGSNLGGIDREEWLKVLEINTLAPLFVTEAFVDHIAQSENKMIAILTSKMGSVEDNTSGGSYLYRSSKAGVNQIAKSLSIDLEGQGIKVALLHPGWVQTDMGGANALINTETSVSGMKSILDNFDQSSSGSFLAFDGQSIPW